MQTVTKARARRMLQNHMAYHLFVKQLMAIPIRLTGNITSATETSLSFSFIKKASKSGAKIIKKWQTR